MTNIKNRTSCVCVRAHPGPLFCSLKVYAVILYRLVWSWMPAVELTWFPECVCVCLWSLQSHSCIPLLLVSSKRTRKPDYLLCVCVYASMLVRTHCWVLTLRQTLGGLLNGLDLIRVQYWNHDVWVTEPQKACINYGPHKDRWTNVSVCVWWSPIVT